MKTTDVYDVKRTGDLGGDRVAMKIDSNSIAHLMSVLTDLYSDPVLAVVREYSTNARDSHVEAKVARPIEVTLPNGMNPYFKVRDFGVGLSVDDITNIYSQYGASTKRDTDEQTGMLGLGCKSALTYTSQFTVVGVKNGVKATVLVSRVEDGTGVMEIIDTVSTNDHNGVEISVPVKNSNDFHAKTMQFFSFWEKGSVLVNGQPVEPVKLNMVTDKMGIAAGHLGLGSDIVVMGGVPYPVGQRLYDGNRPYNDNFKVVAFVEIGDVHFVPSREALSFTKRTDAKVTALKAEFTANLIKTAQDDVNAQATHAEAYTKYTEWTKRLGNNITQNLTYNGSKFPSSFAVSKVTVYNSGYSRHQIQNYGSNNLGIESVVSSLMIHDYDGVQLTARHKEKIRHYKSVNNITCRTHYLTANKEGGVWVPDSLRVSWADIKNVTLPGTSGPRAKRVPAWSVYSVTDSYFKDIADLDKTKVPVYISPTARLSSGECQRILTAHPGIQIVSLGENRWDKFKRDFPNASSLQAFVKAQAEAAEKALTDKDKQILSMDRWEKDRIKKLDPSRIDDPSIKDAISIAKGSVTSATLDRYSECVVACRSVNLYMPDVQTVPALDAYPLLGNLGHGTMEHCYIYINAVFAAKQAGTI